MNTMVVLLDGAADDKIPELGDQTPLEYLDKPFIDGVATNGDFGWTDGKAYTHLYLLEFFTGLGLTTPRGLVEAIGLGVPVEEGQVAYRFSPIKMVNGHMEWVYRVDLDMHRKLQDCMVRNLDILGDLNPKLYFYEDGRGVMTVETDKVHGFPMPPTPVPSSTFDMGAFESYIHRMAKEMDGLTVLPWGGGSLNEAGRPRPIPKARNMVMVSKSPSALGVGGLLGMHRKQVDNMWSGFQEAFRRLEQGDVFMHVEETDDISHRRAPDQKVSMLREVDSLLMENIDRLIGHRVAFIIDHGTSSLSGQHLKMNVPFAVSEVVEPTAPTVKFCEKATNYVPLKDLLGKMLD